jgi:hypothetical protein
MGFGVDLSVDNSFFHYFHMKAFRNILSWWCRKEFLLIDETYDVSRLAHVLEI